jgi:hypothetical protein
VPVPAAGAEGDTILNLLSLDLRYARVSKRICSAMNENDRYAPRREQSVGRVTPENSGLAADHKGLAGVYGRRESLRKGLVSMLAMVQA